MTMTPASGFQLGRLNGMLSTSYSRRVLAVMTCLLGRFTLNVPLISAYTVARYESRLEP